MKTIPEIAKELGVEAVLEGGVQRVGDRVRINAQLIDAAMGPYKGKCTGEYGLFRRIREAFVEGDIMLADSYFCSYFLIADMLKRGVDVLFE